MIFGISLALAASSVYSAENSCIPELNAEMKRIGVAGLFGDLGTYTRPRVNLSQIAQGSDQVVKGLSRIAAIEKEANQAFGRSGNLGAPPLGDLNEANAIRAQAKEVKESLAKVFIPVPFDMVEALVASGGSFDSITTIGPGQTPAVVVFQKNAGVAGYLVRTEPRAAWVLVHTEPAGCRVQAVSYHSERENRTKTLTSAACKSASGSRTGEDGLIESALCARYGKRLKSETRLEVRDSENPSQGAQSGRAN